MPSRSARIVVAEPWSILRRGLTGVLQAQHTVVGEFQELDALDVLLAARTVDVAIIGDGADRDLVSTVTRLHGGHPSVALVVLCEHIDAERLRGVLRAGASAVLAKTAEDDHLLDSIGRVLRRERVVDQRFLPLLFGECVEGADRDDVPSLLTARERDVLVHLSRGASNREIAQALLVGESTVKSHLGRIYAKLGVRGRHRAVRRAVELGILG